VPPPQRDCVIFFGAPSFPLLFPSNSVMNSDSCISAKLPFSSSERVDLGLCRVPDPTMQISQISLSPMSLRFLFPFFAFCDEFRRTLGRVEESDLTLPLSLF